jgi:mannitol-1-phosphate/altronate dehydrogenase
MPDDSLLETMLGKFSSPYFRDRIDRVVRQPIRKLGKGDRFLGPALLCLKHGIMPFFILRAAAYGFFVPSAGDEQAAKIEETLASMPLEDAVIKITTLDPSAPDEAIACRLLVGFVQEIRCLKKAEKLRPADGEKTR